MWPLICFSVKYSDSEELLSKGRAILHGALSYSRIPRAGIKILPLGLDDRGSTLHLLSIPDTPISQSRLDHLTQVAGQVCCR